MSNNKPICDTCRETKTMSDDVRICVCISGREFGKPIAGKPSCPDYKFSATGFMEDILSGK